MYDFKKVEEESKKKWEKSKEEIELAIKDNSEKKLFSFLEGPPTANAPPGLHHLEVRTYKDIINKFKFMQGFSVPRKGGWDCHGLPVEVQVEKKLNLKDKKEVEKYGADKFIKKCKEDVFSNIVDWGYSTKELDYWIDLEKPYATLNTNYIESVWWSLKELYKKGLLYEGYKVVPFCPRCGTPLSSHEVSQGYKDIKEESVYIAFKIKNKENEFILAWTTTPWTLPGNVALAVGSEIDYVKIKLPDGDKLILGKEKLELIKGDYQILEELKGKDILGIEYEPLYDIKELKSEKSHQIIPADFVTTEEGTGIVHTAVMYGEDDYKLGKEFGLPEVHTVGSDGKFLEIVPDFIKNKNVKDAEKEIISDLKKRHQLFKIEKITHSYPFCWRCDTQLLYYGVNSWFINVPKVRDRLIELNKEINWYPEHLKEGRFGKWLEGAKDWALSRFKFWGTPLPIWKCSNPKCDNEKIIGSIEELKKEALELPSGELDLHRPWIDNVKIKCDKCGSKMERVKDVIDCWYDSGSASFAQFHYPFENKEEFKKRHPYDFIAEAIDQTRGWFYTLHVLSTILFDKPAYKNVICAGHIVDENGEKMSKSKGNILKPKEIIEKTGVDAVRLQFCTSSAGNQKRFSIGLMKENVLPFLNVLYNINRYYNQIPKNETQLSDTKKIEDLWIISRVNSLIKEVTKNLENYSLYSSYSKIQDFTTREFSRKYIQITRGREDNKKVVGEVLEKISLLIAPFAPYISEEIYSNFSKNLVHLSYWPKPDEKKIDKKLEEKFENINMLLETGLSERDKIGIGLKWPLKKAKIISGKNFSFEELSDELKEIIKNQLNVKGLEFEISKDNEDKKIKIELDTEITPELEAEGYARELSRQIQSFRKKLGLNKNDKIDVNVIVDGEFKKILDEKKRFIEERTNSKKLQIVTTGEKENFKKNTEFVIKGKKGMIVIDAEE